MALSLDHHPDASPSSPSVWGIIVSLVVGIAGFIFVYISVKSNTLLAAFDAPVHDWFFAHRNASVSTAMLFITNLLAPGVFAAIVLVGAICWGLYRKEVWRPLMLVGAMALAAVVSTGIKNMMHRGRPPQAQMVPPLEVDFSFPSGHTIGIAVAILVIAYLVYSRTRAWLEVWCLSIIVLVALIATTRLYLGYHWFTDVSASLFLAFIILGVTMIIDRFNPNRLT